MATEKRFYRQAVNPRYKGARMSDVARALLLPKDPEERASAIAEWEAERERAGGLGLSYRVGVLPALLVPDAEE